MREIKNMKFEEMTAEIIKLKEEIKNTKSLKEFRELDDRRYKLEVMRDITIERMTPEESIAAYKRVIALVKTWQEEDPEDKKRNNTKLIEWLQEKISRIEREIKGE